MAKRKRTKGQQSTNHYTAVFCGMLHIDKAPFMRKSMLFFKLFCVPQSMDMTPVSFFLTIKLKIDHHLMQS